jgi:hypothetical protein
MDSRPWVLLLALAAMVGVPVWAGEDIVRGLFSLLSLRLSTSIATAMVAGAFSIRASRSPLPRCSRRLTRFSRKPCKYVLVIDRNRLRWTVSAGYRRIIVMLPRATAGSHESLPL